MKRLSIVVCMLFLITCGISTEAAAPKSYRLVLPWSKIKSLSQDQREQIYHIHRKALDEIKEVKDREKKAILALLSDAQKLEIIESDEAATVEKKKDAAAARAPALAAATQPSEDEDMTEPPKSSK
jgi:hypothetical protein